MKTNLKTFVTLTSVFVLCLLAFGARAAIILQDNFDSYATGDLTNNSGGFWAGHSGATPINVVADASVSPPNALQVSQSLAQDVNARLTNQPYGTPTGSLVGTNFLGNPVSALYASFTINVVGLPTGGNTYFTHFLQGTTVFAGKVFVITNGAAIGSFRLAVQNNSNTGSNTIPADLSLNTVYTVVTRYVLSSGVTTLWLNPVNEASSPNVTALDTPSRISPQAYAFRQSTSEGIINVDNLVVGTNFVDVIPSSVNPPTIVIQPQDTNVFAGSSASFSALAAGDGPLGYQWYSITNGVTNGIVGATGLTVTLTGLATNQTGSIFAVVTNAVGTNSTRLAVLTVSPQPISPTIDTNIFPAGSTNVVGDTVTFSVVAHGLPAPAYQWKVIPGTNTSITNIIAGATSPTLTLSNVDTNQSGTYFVTITNAVPVGYTSTNSALAILKVNPPPFLTIAQFRSMVDGSFAPTNTTAIFTVQGTVTTWTNMTTSAANTEFYMQDASGGIAVFWSGAAKSNLPPAGAVVRVSGPMAAFNGLLEIEPVFTNTLHTVAVLSTGNPLPTPQPLPFDPNVAGNLATMKAMESTYFVASNVTLTAGATFSGNVNEPITANASNVLANSMFSLTFTNLQGQTFTLFINAATDIPGNVKPTGPVTIYGVLGYFTSAGFEFTPSRYADIISYNHVTNVLSYLVRPGDLQTNTFTESFLLPGKTLTTYASIGDAGGGNVTLTPITDGLPASAHWDSVTNGFTATAKFHFSPTTADSGSNYVVALGISATSGTAFTNTFTVYVPTTNEQKMCISEFLANPTTNTSAPHFNPLHRSTDTIGIVTNDQYIEVVNLSGIDLGPGWDVDSGNPNAKLFDSNAGATGTTLSSSNALVIYGGNLTEIPNLPSASATTGSLLLPTSGTGVLVLRNQDGHIIDRVVYAGTDLSTNSSLSRFPTISGALVPQAYVSINNTTAGLQYDSHPWNFAPQIPTGVSNIVVSVTNKQAVLRFTAVPNQATTLWSANTVTEPFRVIFGQPFATSTGVFSVTNLPPAEQFYFITTQTNGQLAP